MQELTFEQVEVVSGGVGPGGAIIGGAISGISAAISGASVGQVVSATALGAASGFFGGVGLSAWNAGQRMTGALHMTQAVAQGVAAGAISSGK